MGEVSGRAGLAAPDAVRVERELAPVARTTYPTRRLLRSVVLLAMVVVAILLGLDVAYFARGSLEWFPTAEQEDTVRRVNAAIAALLLASELVLWLVLRQLNRGATPRRSR